MTGQQRKLGRSAGELEGKQANGMMPKSMQGNVSRRQHVSGLKAVFHFVEAWDAIFFPTIKPLDGFWALPMVSLYFGNTAISKKLF